MAESPEKLSPTIKRKYEALADKKCAGKIIGVSIDGLSLYVDLVLTATIQIKTDYKEFRVRSQKSYFYYGTRLHFTLDEKNKLKEIKAERSAKYITENCDEKICKKIDARLNSQPFFQNIASYFNNKLYADAIKIAYMEANNAFHESLQDKNIFNSSIHRINMFRASGDQGNIVDEFLKTRSNFERRRGWHNKKYNDFKQKANQVATEGIDEKIINCLELASKLFN